MRTESLTLHGAIAAPMDRVFRLITDPERFAEWLPGCYGASGEVRKGTQVSVRFGPRASLFHIIDFEVPQTLGWTEVGARTGSKTFFQLGFAGATTAMKMMHIWPAPSFSSRIKAMFKERRNPQRALDQTLQNLRKLTTR